MNSLLDEVKQLLDRDDIDVNLKANVLSHINQDATLLSQLFTKKYANSRKITVIDNQTLIYNDVVSLLLAYAPVEVCLELATIICNFSNEAVTTLMCARDIAVNGQLHRVIHTVMLLAPSDSRTLFLNRIIKLSDVDIGKIIFGYSDFLSKILRTGDEFTKIINVADEANTLLLIKILAKIAPTFRLELFKIWVGLSMDYSFFREIFKKNITEKQALAILAILNQYEDSNLTLLIFSNHETVNLLHIIFAFHSKLVIETFLLILNKLNPNDYYYVFSTRAVTNVNNIFHMKTPLTVAFERTKNQEIGVFISQSIINNLKIKPLFTTNSLVQFYSPMHDAAACGNLAVIQYFVEHANTTEKEIDHRSIHNYSMASIAKERGHLKVNSLFNSLASFKLLADNADEITVSAEINKAINQDQAVLTYQQSNGDTLLHLAIAKEYFEVATLLIDKNAPCDLLNDRQQNCLCIALLKNNVTLINLIINATSTSIDLVNHSLNHLTIKNVDYTHLKMLFEQQSHCALQDILQTYALKNNDSIIFFISCLTNLMAKKKDTYLLEQSHIFLKKWLTELSHNLPSLLENTLQLQLVCFIFTLSPSDFLTIIAGKSWTNNLNVQLAQVLISGLIQPAVITALTVDDYLMFSDQLTALSDVNHDFFASLAKISLQRLPLTLLAPKILLKMTQALNCQTMLACNNSRGSLVLNILTLTKAVNEKNYPDNLLPELTKKLQQELSVFNNAALDFQQKEFELALNLASHDTVKQLISTLLKNSDHSGYLSARIERYFNHFSSSQALLAQSFLREQCISLCNKPMPPLASFAAKPLTQLLCISTKQETRKIMSAIMPEVLGHWLTVSTWIKPLSADNGVEQLKLMQELMSLAPKNRYFVLIDFFGVAAKLYQLLDNNHGYLKNVTTIEATTHSTLMTAYENLLQNLEILCALMQESNQNTIISIKIKTVLEQMSLDYQFIIMSKPINSSNYIPIDHVNYLDQLKTINQDIQLEKKQSILTFDNFFANNALLSPLILFFSQQPLVAIPLVRFKTITMQVMQQIQNKVVPLIIDITQSLLNNPNVMHNADIILPWLKTGLNYCDSPKIYQALGDYCCQYGAGNWLKINTDLKKSYVLFEQLKPVFSLLKSLAFKSLTTLLSQLITELSLIDKQLLIQLRTLVAAIAQDDFLLLIDYLLLAQKNSVSIEAINYTSSIADLDIRAWLKQCYQSIETYKQYLGSTSLIIEGITRQSNSDEVLILTFTNIIMLAQNKMHAFLPNALVYFISHYQNLLQAPLSLVQHRLVSAIYCLFQNFNLDQINTIVNALPLSCFKALFRLCLNGTNSDDERFNHACEQLLMLTCQNPQFNQQSYLIYIKQSLDFQHLRHLTPSNLLAIAQSILQPQPDDDKTNQGLWIQRLLTSTTFFAEITPAMISALLLRYRLLSSILKQQELDKLADFIKKNQDKCSYSNSKITDQILQLRSQQLNRLALKKASLLSFRLDESIRALFIILEKRIQKLQLSQPGVATRASNNLYGYLNQALDQLRTDNLFKVSCFFHDYFTVDKGDLAITKSTLLRLVNNYLPHLNFEQKELISKNTTELYNEQGKQIAVVGEFKKIIFLNEAESVDAYNDKDKVIFYDKNRRLVGTFNNGQLSHHNIFQKHTSALFLAHVPIDELVSSSNLLLELLINDIIVNEQAIDTLYQHSDKQKKEFLVSKVQAYLSSAQNNLTADNACALVTHHAGNELLKSIETMKQSNNVHRLLLALITSPKAAKLFSQSNAKLSLANIFKQHPPLPFFVALLQNYYQQANFAQSISIFSQFVAEHNQYHTLLTDALILLNEQVFSQKKWSKQDYNGLLTTLISNQHICTDIWKHFLQAKITTPINGVDKKLALNFSEFFDKSHINLLLDKVKTTNWDNCKQYRLLLLLLNYRLDCVLPVEELRFSERSACSPDELMALSQFARLHFYYAQNPDINLEIGKTLLAKLLLRTANNGMLDLFYHNQNQFDRLMADQTLNNMVSINNTPNYITQIISAISDKVKPMSADLQQKRKEIQHYGGIVNWQDIMQQTLSRASSMSYICAYLINYSGPSAAVIPLVNDYLHQLQHPEPFHAIAKIMSTEPKHTISSCIYTALEAQVIKNTSLLDKPLMEHLACYYCYHKNKRVNSVFEKNLLLLCHFGHLKHYALVKKCCELLVNSGEIDVNDKTSRRLIKHIYNEATVEEKLINKQHKWYFRLLKFIQRLWYYGFKKPSGYVVFCDKQDNHANIITPVATVITPTINGKEIHQQVKNNKKTLAKAREIKAALDEKDNARKRFAVTPQALFKPGLVTSNETQYIPSKIFNR